VKKKKLPKSVNILGHVYQVKIVPQDKLPNGVNGLCEWPTRVISISKDLQGEMAIAVFWHEVWHGVQFENGDMQILHAQVQEKHCDMFSSIISSFKKQGIL